MPLYNRIKIAILSLDIAWCDIEKNLERVETSLIDIEPDTDILVLPELFSTGFIHDDIILKEVAEKNRCALEHVKYLSSKYHIAIAGSLLAKENENIFNRGFFVEPSGEVACYDKRHLFCLSPEAVMFSQGNTPPPIIRYRGWNISMVICYDLRFPVWCRNKESKTDIMIVPANWPMSRSFAWKHLLIARAIENQCVVIGANRSGEDEYGKYDSLSFVYDATGHIIVSSAMNNSNNKIIYATYTKEELHRIRTKLPFGKDADDFIIQF